MKGKTPRINEAAAASVEVTSSPNSPDDPHVRQEELTRRLEAAVVTDDNNLKMVLEYIGPVQSNTARRIIARAAADYGAGFYQELLPRLQPTALGAPAATRNIKWLQEQIRDINKQK